MVSCKDDNLYNYDCTSRGEDVSLTLAISLPEMDLKTRANLGDWQINQVDNVWIATYDALSGKMTSLTKDGKSTGWHKIDNPSDYIEPLLKNVTINTKSGSSYIVAVANVDNNGTKKDDPDLTIAPLSELLDDADTWEDFLNIAVVSPSTHDDVYAAPVPMTMSGCWVPLKIGESGHDGDFDIYNWQNHNFKPVSIDNKGNILVDNAIKEGAIHLRRVVSQIKFNIQAGDGINITPTSYTVVNAPKYSWVYERAGDNANFGDNCIESNKDNYYESEGLHFSQTYFENMENNKKYSFDFWQAENKHKSINSNIKYDDREKVLKEGEANGPETQQNTTIFTSLSGMSWTPNNMASYVIINCYVEHANKLSVDGNGNIVEKNDTDQIVDAQRNGNAKIVVHLGYISNVAEDFNCYRNAKYTYNITINGLNDIVVEANLNDETKPSLEGIVTDVTDKVFDLDCHYCSFNVFFTETELQPYKNENGISSGFDFIINAYEDNQPYIVEAKDFVGEKTPKDIDPLYYNWIELIPTTGENVRAPYNPENTLKLYDFSRGLDLSQYKKDSEGRYWFTVHVNENVYEESSNEEKKGNANPRWMKYVNQNLRRFYMRVNRNVSHDGQSIYARSKYAAEQKSIMTYYSNLIVPTKNKDGQTDGAALGIEHENETLGLNLRNSFTYSDLTTTNGRLNLWKYAQSTYNGSDWDTPEGTATSGKKWNDFILTQQFQDIPYTENFDPRTETVPKIGPFKGDFTKNNNNKTIYDASPGKDDYYIEAISACLNRNRDNNGDGVINRDEIRWYVPEMGKYLRIILGNSSLADDRLIDYKSIASVNEKNNVDGKYMFFSSEGRVLWGMQGMATSDWCQWGSESPVAPWQVRCVRNLGTNLNTEVVTIDKTVPAYVFTGTVEQGGIVELKYYDVSSKRQITYSGNGTASNQMPVHRFYDSYNNVHNKFQISIPSKSERIGSETLYYDFTISKPNTYSGLITSVNNNPCNVKGDGWRLPNAKEIAIMRNLGFCGALPQDSFGNPFMLSCTVSQFDKNGENPTTVNNLRNHYFMVARWDAITQMSDEAFGYVNSIFYVRCVKDVD